MDKSERDFLIAELIEEAKEQERFERFYESVPSISKRHGTLESHLPLIFRTTNIEQKET